MHDCVSCFEFELPECIPEVEAASHPNSKDVGYIKTLALPKYHVLMGVKVPRRLSTPVN